MTLQVLLHYEGGHTAPKAFEPEEHSYWLAMFRSPYGARNAIVHELMIEMGARGATVTWDGCRQEFSRDEPQRYIWPDFTDRKER